jgi:hypothetical protein
MPAIAGATCKAQGANQGGASTRNKELAASWSFSSMTSALCLPIASLLRAVLQSGSEIILLRRIMTTLKKPVALLLLLAFGALLAGCNTKEKNSAIPWSRPAGWEGQIPGMSTSTGR